MRLVGRQRARSRVHIRRQPAERADRRLLALLIAVPANANPSLAPKEALVEGRTLKSFASPPKT